MKRTALTLSTLALALSSCDNTYTNWELPNVIRKNQPVVAPAPKPARSTQVQHEFKKPEPKPAPTTQVQPEFKKPEPKPARTTQVQPELPKPEVKPTPVVKAPEPKPARTAQIQPEPPKTKKPARTEQVQPELPNPEVKQAPAPKPVVEAPKPQPVVKKSAVAVSSLPNTQVQPEFKKPAPKPVQATRYTPRPVMTPAQKEQFPVMPGQNRALKRRR